MGTDSVGTDPFCGIIFRASSVIFLTAIAARRLQASHNLLSHIFHHSVLHDFHAIKIVDESRDAVF